MEGGRTLREPRMHWGVVHTLGTPRAPVATLHRQDQTEEGAEGAVLVLSVRCGVKHTLGTPQAPAA